MMYTPPVRNRPASGAQRAAAPVSRTRATYGDTDMGVGGSGLGLSGKRDQYEISDESRLRAEYSFRLMRESQKAQRKRGDNSPGLPSLEDTARAYSALLDEIHVSFHPEIAVLHRHSEALSYAWDSILSTLAEKNAERLSMTIRFEGTCSRSLLCQIISDIHHQFAEKFREARPLHGVEGAIRKAVGAVTESDEFERENMLSITDTMALHYYRDTLEKKYKRPD